tara:strand:+ start:1554 stop:1877 length:324 start_codon:yes stop_codon:yes gene_type:complete
MFISLFDTVPQMSLAIFGLGPQELIIILIIVLLVFGSTKLPQLGSGLGKSIKNFKKSMREEEEADAKKATAPTTVVQVEVQRPDALESQSVTEAVTDSETETSEVGS